MKKLDLYIIRKFLGTFFFSLVLILCIVVVFDLSEKLEKFLENEAPVKAIGSSVPVMHTFGERKEFYSLFCERVLFAVYFHLSNLFYFEDGL